MKPIHKVLLAAVIILIVASACGASAPSAPATPDPNALRITAGSEVKSVMYDADGNPTKLLKGLQDQGISISFTFKGSVEIKSELVALGGKPSNDTDVYIPASTLQLAGNTTSYPSAMKTFVVLMVDRDAAKGLGWDPAKGISVTDLINAIRADQIHLAMTNSSQSNSGQTFYLAALTALCGQDVLTNDCLTRPDVVDGITTLLHGIDKTAESTGFLADRYVDDKSGENRWNAMVTYESTAIQTNQKLGGKWQYIFYVSGATAVADEPIVFTGTPEKQAAYAKFLAAMQSDDAKKALNDLGWRTPFLGMAQPDLNTKTFNPDWGVDTTTEFVTMTFPRPEVVQYAVSTYQSTFRKPSFTVYVLDFSGSMDGNGGRTQLLNALGMLFDQSRASAPDVNLQMTKDDVTVVFVFWGDCQFVGRVGGGVVNIGTAAAPNNVDYGAGNDQARLTALYNQIASYSTGPSTAMFSCSEAALDYVKNNHSDMYQYAIIPMTDGGSNSGDNAEGFKRYYKNFVQKNGYEVPVFGIAFGNAIDEGQLNAFKSKTVGGFWYNAGTDLVKAFQKARGNN